MHVVVLADDSPTIRKLVELSFEGETFVFHSFSDGGSALDYLQNNPADVVLADVSLPGMDGYSLCSEITQGRTFSRAQVVLLAGTFEPFDLKRAENAGYHSYLTKPFQTSQLLSLVGQLLDESREETWHNPQDDATVSSGRPRLRSVPSSTSGDGPRSEVGVERTGEQAARKETRTVNRKALLFSLTPGQCRPVPTLVRSDDWAEPDGPVPQPVSPAESFEQQAGDPVAPISGSISLTPEQIDVVVTRVMARLPGEIRRVVSEVLQELGRPQ
jgi:twitching motility two-component system response regulator PilG